MAGIRLNFGADHKWLGGTVSSYEVIVPANNFEWLLIWHVSTWPCNQVENPCCSVGSVSVPVSLWQGVGERSDLMDRPRTSEREPFPPFTALTVMSPCLTPQPAHCPPTNPAFTAFPSCPLTAVLVYTNQTEAPRRPGKTHSIP